MILKGALHEEGGDPLRRQRCAVRHFHSDSMSWVGQ